tara:strand:- start:116 stop:703 length:588 start_codon:yes stop_codon:yes gene_type:complete
MSLVRSLAVWLLVPAVIALTVWKTKEGVFDSELAIWIVVATSFFASYIIDQVIERARSPKLAALATTMGMQFDANSSWISFFPRTSKFACLEKSTIPFLNKCTGFKNIFVVNSEPAIFGCQYETGGGQYSTTVYRTVYRHKGEAVIDADKIREAGWQIEIGEGFTIYYQEKYRAAPDAIKEEYRQTQELHKSLRT